MMSDKNTPIEHDPASNKRQSMHAESSKTASHNQEGFSALARRFLWADSDSSVERLIFWLGILCVILFVLDFIIHRHAYAPGEGLPGFYAIVGFSAFTIIVLGASQLRRLILRNEDYYSPHSVDAERYPEDGLERLNHTSEAVASKEATTDDEISQSSDTDAQGLIQRNSDQGDSA